MATIRESSDDTHLTYCCWCILRIGAVLQNPNIVGEGFTNLVFIQHIIGIVRAVAGSIFGNLPLLFAVSIAFGLANKEKTIAAFSSVIGFILFHIVIQYLLNANGISLGSHSVEASIESGMDTLDATQGSSRYETALGIHQLNTLNEDLPLSFRPHQYNLQFGTP